MGAVVNLTRSDEENVETAREPICCTRCGAYLNPFCTLDMQRSKWKCNFCQLDNLTPPETNLKDLKEVNSDWVDYVTQKEPTSHSSTIAVVVFVLDLTFSQPQLSLISESIKKAAEIMDKDVKVGLVLVDSCVSLCNLKSKSAVLDLHCVPGHTINMPAALRRPAGGFSSVICPLHSCLSQLFSALDVLTTTKPRLPERSRPRSLGTAIHEALMAIRETRDSRHVGQERVVVLTCGPPNHGPGAVPSDFSVDNPLHNESKQNSQEFFARVADVASGMKVKVDLYGVSFSPIGLSLIEPLPKSTNGILSLHSVITPEILATQFSESVRRGFGTNGMFDVRLSKGLRLSSIIGQVSERFNLNESKRRKTTNNACVLRSIEVGKALSIYFEATTDFGYDDIYIQVLLSWEDSKRGVLVERVANLSITPTGNLSEFLKSIDPVTSSVLLCKKAVLESSELLKKNKADKVEDVRNSLAYKLSFMAQKFGKLLESKGTGFLGFRLEKKWACPLELWYLAMSLYHLARGPLLSTPGGLSEEVVFLQTIYLTAALDSSDRMVVPKLYQVDPTGTELIEKPALTLSLSQESVMLLDHGVYQFIWKGKNSGDKEEAVDLCRKFVLQKCKERGMMAELLELCEGEQDDVLFLHLIPSHMDNKEDQLSQTGQGIVKDIRYPPTKNLSLYQWCREVGVEPPKIRDLFVSPN